MQRKKKLLLVTIIAIILLSLSFIFDKQISLFVTGLRVSWLNDLLIGLTYVTPAFVIFFFLTSLFLWKERKRKWIFPLWLTLAMSAIISFLLKVIVRRQRPFELSAGISAVQSAIETSFSTWNLSFPSFQSMLVFSALPILSKEFRKFKYIWLCLALIISFSRVYFGVHFLSDVIAGGLIGYFIGLAIVKIQEKYGLERIYKKRKKLR